MFLRRFDRPFEDFPCSRCERVPVQQTRSHLTDKSCRRAFGRLRLSVVPLAKAQFSFLTQRAI